VTLTTPDGKSRHLPSKGAFVAAPGSVVDMITPGSGGYGSPRERDPKLLGDDLLNGYVTLEAARDDYGVEAPEALLREARATVG